MPASNLAQYKKLSTVPGALDSITRAISSLGTPADSLHKRLANATRLTANAISLHNGSYGGSLVNISAHLQSASLSFLSSFPHTPTVS
jgi:hypothetical protein